MAYAERCSPDAADAARFCLLPETVARRRRRRAFLPDVTAALVRAHAENVAFARIFMFLLAFRSLDFAAA